MSTDLERGPPRADKQYSTMRLHQRIRDGTPEELRISAKKG
jgi:hypothetical protein